MRTLPLLDRILPKGLVEYLVVFLVALSAGGVGSIAGGWLAWRTAAALPSDTTVASLAQTFVPTGVAHNVQRSSRGYSPPARSPLEACLLAVVWDQTTTKSARCWPL